MKPPPAVSKAPAAAAARGGRNAPRDCRQSTFAKLGFRPGDIIQSIVLPFADQTSQYWAERFRKEFGLPEDQKLLAHFACSRRKGTRDARVMPGRVFLFTDTLVFTANVLGTTKMKKINLSNISEVVSTQTLRKGDTIVVIHDRHSEANSGEQQEHLMFYSKVNQCEAHKLLGSYVSKIRGEPVAVGDPASVDGAPGGIRSESLTEAGFEPVHGAAGGGVGGDNGCGCGGPSPFEAPPGAAAAAADATDAPPPLWWRACEAGRWQGVAGDMTQAFDLEVECPDVKRFAEVLLADSSGFLVSALHQQGNKTVRATPWEPVEAGDERAPALGLPAGAAVGRRIDYLYNGDQKTNVTLSQYYAPFRGGEGAGEGAPLLVVATRQVMHDVPSIVRGKFHIATTWVVEAVAREGGEGTAAGGQEDEAGAGAGAAAAAVPAAPAAAVGAGRVRWRGYIAVRFDKPLNGFIKGQLTSRTLMTMQPALQGIAQQGKLWLEDSGQRVGMLEELSYLPPDDAVERMRRRGGGGGGAAHAPRRAPSAKPGGGGAGGGGSAAGRRFQSAVSALRASQRMQAGSLRRAATGHGTATAATVAAAAALGAGYKAPGSAAPGGGVGPSFGAVGAVECAVLLGAVCLVLLVSADVLLVLMAGLLWRLLRAVESGNAARAAQHLEVSALLRAAAAGADAEAAEGRAPPGRGGGRDGDGGTA